MFADQALRCECGYEVRASDEAARVDEVRRHASETHGIDLSADVALDVVRRVTARAEQLGGQDMFVATCDSTDDPGSAPVNLRGAINKEAAETRPTS